MKIYLINVIGSGIELDIKNKNSILGVKSDTTIIEIINEKGKVIDYFSFDDLKAVSKNNNLFIPETGYLEKYGEGLFYQFEIFLDNDEELDYDLLKLCTVDYDGEDYVCDVMYEDMSLDCIDSSIEFYDEFKK